MKNLILICSASALLWAGCGKESSTSQSTTNSASSGNPLTAPADYLGAVGQAKVKAEKTIDVASLTQAIQMFNVSEGRYPNDLQELVTGGFIPRIPEPPYGTKLVYDATKGEVRIVKQ